MIAVADTVGYDGPRGAMHIRNGHVRQHVHLAVADNLDFDVITVLP
jgi:hypothetical protein